LFTKKEEGEDEKNKPAGAAPKGFEKFFKKKEEDKGAATPKKDDEKAAA